MEKRILAIVLILSSVAVSATQPGAPADSAAAAAQTGFQIQLNDQLKLIRDLREMSGEERIAAIQARKATLAKFKLSLEQAKNELVAAQDKVSQAHEAWVRVRIPTGIMAVAGFIGFGYGTDNVRRNNSLKSAIVDKAPMLSRKASWRLVGVGSALLTAGYLYSKDESHELKIAADKVSAVQAEVNALDLQVDTEMDFIEQLDQLLAKK